MSTLGLRPDNRGGLGPAEKWSSPATGSWGNHYQSVVNALEPTPSFLDSPQAMFPHLMHDSALGQSLKMDALHNYGSLETYNTLLQSSNSNSMVESSTSDEDVCTAAPPEIQMNCISVLGGGPVSPVVTSLLDRTQSVSGGTLEDWNHLRLHQTRSPCQVNADGCSTEVPVPGLKRRLELEQISGHRKMYPHEKAQAALQDSFGGYAEVSDTAPVVQKSNCGSSGAGVGDMDSIRAILFCHASQPVPSVEEMASTRPKRRNVRISKDPQSVAARHRRERISDRMRVLQRLVPGGTKMDTASMLDEAIHYVKFLKLQLQTLEQFRSNPGANSCDTAQAGTSIALPQGEAQLGRRPFQLNTGTAFQSWTSNNTTTISSNNTNTNNTTSGQIQAPPQAGRRISNQWT